MKVKLALFALGAVMLALGGGGGGCFFRYLGDLAADTIVLRGID